ncbi:MAG: Gfo/Idh/MocA family oxidoreductase [Verrucomicrobia bacterium]|nr:Gfo/Idh/MocA family oxidoreductase [Verrucomicrobiota bacterium]
MGGPLKVAVIGTGALGKHHARLYADLAIKGKVDFIGVYDIEHSRAVPIAQEYAVTAFKSIDAIAERSQAVSIVTPTATHFEVTKKCLESGCDVLVEKPIAPTLDQAREMVEIAQRENRLLQVGHVERFNPVFSYIADYSKNPQFIEAHRLSSFPSRSTDIGVVLDLMIHDIDIILALVKSPVQSVEATGVRVLSEREDIANARIRFENGCIANITASRVSPEQLRKIRVFSGYPNQSYISLDYKNQKGEIYRLAREGEKETGFLTKFFQGKSRRIVSQFGGRKIVREPVPIAVDEPLALELLSFIECVNTRMKPLVSGEEATATLNLALEITQKIAANSSMNPSILGN